MPIYEYQCANCGYQKDIIQKIADLPMTLCDECNTEGLKKLVSAPHFRLKGSGWYETDFKTDKDKKKNLADSKEKKVASKLAKESSKKDNSSKAAAPTATTSSIKKADK
jgi:putative FmdB family regulatory protein